LKIVTLLLLAALFFNISHASLIAIEDDCQHETAQEYVMEQTQASDCGDLCDMHHLFHFMAITAVTVLSFDTLLKEAELTEKTTLYTSPRQKTTIKPPIA
jgi:hypothetical protein